MYNVMKSGVFQTKCSSGIIISDKFYESNADDPRRPEEKYKENPALPRERSNKK
jgi:hypothetical protein